MVIALVMLLVALGLVLIKDRDFWFPAPETTESEAFDDTAPADETAQPATPATAAASTPTIVKKRPAPVARKAPEPAPPAAPAVTASRAVLPPLRVEVVAGDQHQVVRPGSPSVKVELQNGAPGQIASEAPRAPVPVPDSQPITTKGDRVQMSTDTRQALTRPVRPEYLLLAQADEGAGRGGAFGIHRQGWQHRKSAGGQRTCDLGGCGARCGQAMASFKPDPAQWRARGRRRRGSRWISPSASRTRLIKLREGGASCTAFIFGVAAGGPNPGQKLTSARISFPSHRRPGSPPQNCSRKK